MTWLKIGYSSTFKTEKIQKKKKENPKKKKNCGSMRGGLLAQNSNLWKNIIVRIKK